MNAEDFRRKIEEKLLAYGRRQGLLAPHTRVIAACSGGADSMALLLYLLAERQKMAWTVEAVHVNHGLRGAQSDADEAFVRAFCREQAVPLTVFHARQAGDIPAHPGEDWARRLRYGFFAKLAAPGTVIATAHTASDQAETLLLHLARGAGVRGAGGMAPARPGFARPLLCLTRAETEGYCAAWAQPFVTDATNETDEYARNRVRHGAIPALESVSPAAVPALARFCEKMQALDAFLDRQAAQLLKTAQRADGYEAAVLAAAEPVLRDAALVRLVRPVRDAEEKYVRLLAALVQNPDKNGAVQLTDAVVWEQKNGQLRRRNEAPQLPAPAAARPLAEGIFRLPGGYTVEICRCKYEKIIKNGAVHKKDLKNLADCAKIQSIGQLRTRLPGDFFRQVGRGSKTVKKLYNELALDARARALQPLAACGSQVIWLWGRGTAAQVQPEESTREVWLFREVEKTGQEE